jgi:hypothetical protein
MGWACATTFDFACNWRTTMNFLDGHLFPENQDKLVITAAPYGPEWIPSDFPEDIAVSMPAQIQKAVDCYNAGATVLHLHVREDDGKGSKRLSKFNELIAGVRKAVPDMIIQVGGSISFAPETDGQVAVAVRRHAPHAGRAGAHARPGDGDREHHADERDRAHGGGRHRRHLHGHAGWPPRLQRDRSTPSFVEEHVRRLSAGASRARSSSTTSTATRRSNA